MRRRRPSLRAAALALVLLAAAGCATIATDPRDPFEGFNRAMYAFNDGLDEVAVKPVSRAYKAVAPEPLRGMVRNFFSNIDDVFNGAEQCAAGQVPGRLDRLVACHREHQLRRSWHQRRGKRHGPGEAQRGLRPDLRRLGRGRRPLPGAAVLRPLHAARQRRPGARLGARSGGARPAHRAAQFPDRHALRQQAHRLSRRQPHAGRGGARPLRVPARRLPAAPAQPDLRRQPAARAAARRSDKEACHEEAGSRAQRSRSPPRRAGAGHAARRAGQERDARDPGDRRAGQGIAGGRPRQDHRPDRAEGAAALQLRQHDRARGGAGLAEGDARAEEAPGGGIPRPAGAHLRQLAHRVPRPEARFPAAAHEAGRHRRHGAGARAAVGRAAGGHRVRHGEDGARLEVLRRARRPASAWWSTTAPSSPTWCAKAASTA